MQRYLHAMWSSGTSSPYRIKENYDEISVDFLRRTVPILEAVKRAFPWIGRVIFTTAKSAIC